MLRFISLFILFFVLACSSPNSKSESSPTETKEKKEWEFISKRTVKKKISKSKEEALENLANFFDHNNHTQYNCGTSSNSSDVNNIIDTYNYISFVLNENEESLYFKTRSGKLMDSIRIIEYYKIPLGEISFQDFELLNDPNEFCTLICLVLNSKYNSNSFLYRREEIAHLHTDRERKLHSYSSKASKTEIHLKSGFEVERLHSIFEKLLKE